MGVSTDRWFEAWRRRHLRIVSHAHFKGPAYDMETEEGRDYWQGWFKAFEREHVTEEEAHEATDRLQADHPGIPANHLPALLAAIRAGRPATRGPSIEEERERAAVLKAEREREEAEAEARKIEWERVPAAERRRRLERMAEAVPSLARFPAMLRQLCVAELRGEMERPSPPPKPTEQEAPNARERPTRTRRPMGFPEFAGLPIGPDVGLGPDGERVVQTNGERVTA